MNTLYEGFFLFIGGVTMLGYEIYRELLRGPLYLNLVAEQVYQLGVKSIPLVFLTAGSIGMVMSLQFGMGLEKFGGKLYVPKLIAATVIREIGPVFTSLLLAGRLGAGIASEIGSMVVTQQIDAIRALGTSPIKKIVIPRVIAMLICVPLLVAFANIVGIAGAMMIASTELGLDPQFYLLKTMDTIKLADYLSGFGKTFFFALFISVPSCYYGLNVTDGTHGVGSATTRAVVTASILVLIGDFFLSKLFWIIQKWN
jgi:phospholipid/cholesterol/gamma-HCH transport system permease protein